MRIASRLLSVVIIAALAACSGSGTVPPSTPGASGADHLTAQPVPRRVTDSTTGATRSILYTKEIELGGRVSAGPSNVRVPLASASNMVYNGGLVQTAPKMYVVYWGSTWTSTGDPRHVQPYLNNFLSVVGGSAWLGTVTQYTQTVSGVKTAVGNASGSYAGSWNDTSAIPNLNSSSTYQSYLAAEAQKAATHFGDRSQNVNYIIALPHSVKVYQFAGSCGWICYFIGAYCAWHSTTTSNGSTIAYTNLPYQPDAGSSCGSGSVNGSTAYNDGVSIVTGHEQAEAETDPQLNAWYDSSGNEIGDKCAWTNLQNVSFGGNTLGTNYFPTQPLWSNAVGGCVQ